LSLLQCSHHSACNSDSALGAHLPSASNPPFPCSTGEIDDEASGMMNSSTRADAIADERPTMGGAMNGHVYGFGLKYLKAFILVIPV